MIEPIKHLNQWLKDEQAAGAPNPQQAVLSTSTPNAVPHGRVVAIREVSEQGLLFFTQQGTRKVFELAQNPFAAMTFWLELLQREVIIEGLVHALTPEENEHYWHTYPREAQIRFHSYAPTSSQPIISKQELVDKMKEIQFIYQNKVLPMSPLYCGYRLKPDRMVFYTYRTDALSDVIEYNNNHAQWIQQLLSP